MSLKMPILQVYAQLLDEISSSIKTISEDDYLSASSEPNERDDLDEEQDYKVAIYNNLNWINNL